MGRVFRRARGAAILRGAFGPVKIFADMGITQNNPPITAICEVPGNRTNITLKQAGLAASGWVEVRGKRHHFEPDALGFLDYTHGLMAHHTSWWWAIGAGISASGKRLAFNLVDGFNQGRENVLWIDGEAVGFFDHFMEMRDVFGNDGPDAPVKGQIARYPRIRRRGDYRTMRTIAGQAPRRRARPRRRR